MARLARIVVPDIAHHVTQRCNRKLRVFFREEDYAAYRALIAEGCARAGVSCLAWCLMPNHIHLVLTPPSPEALRQAIAEAHRRFSRRINVAQGWTGYLFQGRFASFPVDPERLLIVVRYVEMNPVRAGLVPLAEQWRWSSARAHITGKPDGLTDLNALVGVASNWRALLQKGVEAGDEDPAAAEIERHQRTGRPWGSAGFIKRLEAMTGRTLTRRKPGRQRREN